MCKKYDIFVKLYKFHTKPAIINRLAKASSYGAIGP